GLHQRAAAGARALRSERHVDGAGARRRPGRRRGDLGDQPETASRVGEERRAWIVWWHARPPCRGQQSWRGKRGTYDTQGVLRGELRTRGLYVLRAYQDCRAGFAGRDMQVERATGCARSRPIRPKTQSWVGLLLHVAGVETALLHGLLFPPPAAGALVLARVGRASARLTADRHEAAIVDPLLRHIALPHVRPHL